MYGQVADLCEICGVGDLDLSEGLFSSFDSLDIETFSVYWEFMPMGFHP